MKVIFDLDGTLADIRHRVHFVRDGARDYDAFFAACVDDVLYEHVAKTFIAHFKAGHVVEIWSARSDKVRVETERWLSQNGIHPQFLTHMRADGDMTEDAALKRSWLHELHPDDWPSIVYDDRQRVVDMWRAEGIPCFQVTENWEAEERIFAPTASPLLRLMIGPSGSGKSQWCHLNVPEDQYLSSDDLRAVYCGDFKDQSRNDDVFYALHTLARARLSCGLPVTIDATNLRRKDRMACVELAPRGSAIEYVVIDRPLPDKIRDGGWRNEVQSRGVPLIEAHDARFKSVIRDVLAGDGLPNVTVIDLRS